MAFTHLQVITTNSLMNSTLTISDLVNHASEQGHQAIALTDHNVLFGAIEFYEMALEKNIKPIIGLTLDVQGYISSDKIYPLILLAKNYQGYQDLIQLSTLYQLSEQVGVPLTEVILRSEDLFVISPGMEGEIISLLKFGRTNEARETAEYFIENMPLFYLGLSLQNADEQMLQFYNNTKLPIVALGDVQYLHPEDEMPTKVLRVLKSEINLGEENQAYINQFLAKEEGDFSLRAPEVLYEAFKEAGFEEAAKETNRIVDQIELEIELGHHIMPSYPVPNGESSDSYLKKLCMASLNRQFDEIPTAYLTRLENELNVITSMGFSDYFLIVWDIITYAHKQNIYTGSGRGSAAGSLVAHLLKITNADPIEYNLLFERFLNKERFTMPDIDLDFPDNRREEILNYIHQKYGHEKVAQIGTIGTYGAKSAIRDVNRVLGQSQEEIKKWARIIPSGPDVTLESAMQQKSFKEFVTLNEQNQQIYHIGKKIEGSNRHISTHAAAVVIADNPLANQVPLQKGSSDIYLTQYTMQSVEKIGLLKLDVLGLRNLSILSDCIRFIPFEQDGQKIDIDTIPFDDQKTLEIFRNGDTDGVFQFESPGIRRVLRKLQPNSFEDIVAVNALYRPGPMEQIDTFIKRKNGEEPIRYPHEDLKEILEITYGVMVYQEQVMQVASKLAGYSLNEADILRRAISKKDHHAIEEGSRSFVQGAVSKGYTADTANEVYGYIERFADYGFNRSHAVAYSKVAYQLAYVKANYPASFFAAVMNASSKDKIKSFVAEAKLMGVSFEAPHINKSYRSFIIDHKKIRFGFDVITGLPRNFIQEIINERKDKGEFTHIINFLSRMDTKWLDKNYILPLIYSGAFDELRDNRSSLLGSIDSVLESIEMSQGNTELFDIFAPTIVEKEDLTDEEKMNQEHEVTGYYFSSEPGEKFNYLRKDGIISYLADEQENKFIKLLVVVEKITRIQTKNGEPMSFVDVIDNTGKGSLTLFPAVHRRYIQRLNEGETILVEGKVEKKSTPIKVIVNKITNAIDITDKKSGDQSKTTNTESKQVLYIRFKSVLGEQKKLEALQEVLKQHRGNTPVVLYDEKTKEQKPFKKKYHVRINEQLVVSLKRMFGDNNIVLRKL